MNDDIINEFEKLIKQIKFDIDTAKNKKESLIHSYRLATIQKVIKVIKEYPTKIKNGDELKDIKGVGKGSIDRINEILKTGKLSEIKKEQIESDYIKYLDELDDVFGIGRKTATELYKKFNIKSIKELKKAHKDGKITLPDNIIKGLKYYGKFKENIPRKEMDKINEYIMKTLKKIDKDLIGEVCGSYRRKKETSNDIDVLISHKKIKTKTLAEKSDYLFKILLALINDKFIVDSLTELTVPTKYMGFCKISKNPIRRIDIRFFGYESYPFGLLYFTGSKDFNRMMRQVAVDMGYTLNEYGLYNIKEKKYLKAKDEKDIFKLLNLEYVDPEFR
jgi:DNA polymerase/3'-5' exonuclease PolX